MTTAEQEPRRNPPRQARPCGSAAVSELQRSGSHASQPLGGVPDLSSHTDEAVGELEDTAQADTLAGGFQLPAEVLQQLAALQELLRAPHGDQLG